MLPIGTILKRTDNLTLCTKDGMDIRSSVMTLFGSVDELLVIEVLVLMNICGHTQLSHTRLFGRSARLIFNSSAAGE